MLLLLKIRSGGNTVSTANTGYVLLANTGTIDMDAPTIDIDAATSMEIDAPTLSIDGPEGNITSNSVTLHTHTHPQNDGNDAGGGADTSAPNADS